MYLKKILFFVFIMFQALFASSSDTVGVLERSLNLSETTSSIFEKKASHFVDKTIKKKESLSGEEIDKIFISFEEEKRRALERKREKKKREEELAVKKKEGGASLLSRASSLAPASVSVFPKTDVEAEKRRIMSGAYSKREKKEKKKTVRRKAKRLPKLFYGTSCINGECVVFTPSGTLKEGDTVIPSGEKIEVIKPYFIKTNLREILL